MLVISLMTVALGQVSTAGPEVACIIDRLPASALAGVVAEAQTGVAGEVRQAFENARDACGRERNWTARQSDRFDRLAASRVIIDQITDHLSRRGIPPALLLEWYEAVPPAQRAEQDSTALDGLIDRYLAAGVTRAQLEANADAIGLLLGALDMVEAAGPELAD